MGDILCSDLRNKNEGNSISISGNGFESCIEERRGKRSFETAFCCRHACNWFSPPECTTEKRVFNCV